MTEDLKLKRAIKAAIFAGAGSLALVSGSAMALETKVYGLIDVWAGSSEGVYDDDSTSELGSGGMTTSYLGFSAEQELEGAMSGTKVVGAVEMFFRPDTAEEGRYDGDTFFARNAFVGLQGDFGLVKAGRQTAPLFLPTILFNPFGDSFVFSPMVLHTFGGGTFSPTGDTVDPGYLVGDSGWSNAVSYSMPGVGGLSGTVIYAFGEDGGNVTDSTVGATDDKVGANLFYRAGALAATVAAHKVDGADGPDHTAFQLGVSYDLGVAKLFGQYQMVENDGAAGDDEYDTFQLGASIPVTAAGSVLLSYVYTDASRDLAEDFERDTIALGYDHKLSEQFDVYAAYVMDDVDTVDDGTTFGVGGRFKF